MITYVGGPLGGKRANVPTCRSGSTITIQQEGHHALRYDVRLVGRNHLATFRPRVRRKK